jgi:hypothetical protein
MSEVTMNKPIAFSSTHPSEMRGRPDVVIVDNSCEFASAEFTKAAYAARKQLFVKPSPVPPSSSEDGR